jgi:hypothetical protein
MIGAGLNPFKWHIVWAESFAASTVTDNARDPFLIQPVNAFHTFAARLRLLTAGTVVVKVRFGLTQPTIVGGNHGFDLPVLNALNQTVMGNIAAANALAAPNVAGNPNLILPPVGRVFVTTVGATLTVELWAAYLGGA